MMKFDWLLKLSGKSGMILKQHSPEILLGVGIAGGIAATILACKATLKVERVLMDHKSNVSKINSAWEMVQNGEIVNDRYTEQDKTKDLVSIYTVTAVNFIKLYGPAVTLGVASIACVIGGHGIMKKRNVALLAAYKVVEEAFNKYRKRVIEEHGEETDYMYKNGLRHQIVEELEVNEETGKNKKIKKMKLLEDPNGLSMYARFFDETCSEWTKNPEYNLMFLQAQQRYFNQMLQVKGHVFLNEVYDALGMERTQAGTVVGWVIGDKDNYIDFGIFDGDRPRAREFVNGYERSILLDFNVDGVIYDVFTKKKA